MIRAGCVVLAHGSGGPREIIGDRNDLYFHSVEEAVERILALIRSPVRQEAARTYLAARQQRFTTERFAERLGSIVDLFVRRQGKARP
jgi:glycosyltransferase involved in cell wall biosynthesis